MNWTPLYSLPVVQEHMARARETGARMYAQNVFAYWELTRNADDAGVDLVESPIEALFELWFEAIQRASRLDFARDLWLRAQENVVLAVAAYRLDFAITTINYRFDREVRESGRELPRIAVELDGHAFHERTREQVAYRNKRDRDLQIAGWKVFHFSGSEIYNQPADCVLQVIEYAARAYSDVDLELIRERLAKKGL